MRRTARAADVTLVALAVVVLVFVVVTLQRFTDDRISAKIA